MIKMNNEKKSNVLFGGVLFLSLLLTWGCSTDPVPPVVAEEPVEVVDIPPPVEDEAPAEDDFGPQEGVDNLATEDLADPEQGEGYDTEELAVVEVEPEPEPEFIPEPEPEVVEMIEPEPEPEVVEEVVVVEEEPIQEPVFEAPPAEDMETAALPTAFQDEEQLQDIHFDYDRDQLTSNNKATLRANAQWLKNNPTARVEIQGHADERGTNNYNLGLGERRALQTKKYLISQGVDESRLYTISYGEEKPFCFESSETCWGDNRRAHFTVAE